MYKLLFSTIISNNFIDFIDFIDSIDFYHYLTFLQSFFLLVVHVLL